ncbi:hypothetical protein [Francisella sp. SYW-9]|uniref:hypothetical protein n=1 Tax=Francisella sp. SYW-9 TaxID=2610888 RepID=UPI00168CCA51|nr:hypothetical protein [Francisella sp. SYW-9]
MIKKITLFLNLTILLLAINMGYSLSENKNINHPVLKTLESENHEQPKNCNTLSTTLMSPISLIGISVGTILMVPVGLLAGIAGGAMMSPMMFDSGGLSDNQFIQPLQIGGAVILGAVIGAGAGAVELPITTASTLTQKAKDNCYLI